MEEKTVRIPNISCQHCIRTIQRELMELPGVKAVNGTPDSKNLTVQWNPPATWDAIVDTLEEIGYPPE